MTKTSKPKPSEDSSEELEIPVSEEAVAAVADKLVDEDGTVLSEEEVQDIISKETPPQAEKVKHTDSHIEFLIGHGEVANEEDEDLPNMLVLQGQAEGGDSAVPEPTSGYQTVSIMNAADRNLIWYPGIVCGRCELCGSKRYVGGDVWKQINRKTGEFVYKYRGGKWVEMDATNCKHYRNVTVECGYCNEQFTAQKDKLGQFSETLGERVVWVVADPSTPKRLVMVCSDFNCKHKFNEQFNINTKI